MLSSITSAAKKAGNNIKYNLGASKDNMGAGINNLTTPRDAETAQEGTKHLPKAQNGQSLKHITTPKLLKRFKSILNREGEVPMSQEGSKLNTVYSFSNGMDSVSSNLPIQSSAIKAGDGISEDNLRTIREMNGGYSTDASGNSVPNYTVTPNQNFMGGGIRSYSVKSPMGINSTYSPQLMKLAMANNQVNYLNADGQPFLMQSGGELPQYLNPQAPIQNKQVKKEIGYVPGTYMAKYFK